MTTKDEALSLALETLAGIADADWRKWEELAAPEEFVRWAKSRANHSANIIREALSQPDHTEQHLEMAATEQTPFGFQHLRAENAQPDHSGDGTEMVADGPVAWVTGYTNGFCTIEALDPAVVLPTGMALYSHSENRQPLSDEYDYEHMYSVDRDGQVEPSTPAKAEFIGIYRRPDRPDSDGLRLAEWIYDVPIRKETATWGDFVYEIRDRK